MAIEKVQAEVIVEAKMDKASFDKANNDVKIFARDTKKELNKELIIKLQLDRANLQIQLDDVRNRLKKAKKEGDKQAVINLTVKSEQLRSELTESTRRLQNYRNTGEESLSRLQKKFNETNETIKKQGGLLDGLKSGFLGLASSISSVVSISKFTDFSNIFTGMQNALKQVSEGKELDILQQKLLDTANNARVPVDDLTKSFVRFDLVNKQLGGTQQETLTILDTLAKGLSMTGATAGETGSVMLQLAQAFGSGRLAGDEFRSVSENMPMLLDILAKQLGVNRGALKDYASEGKITSEVLKTALITANEQITESFNKSSKTIGQALTQIRNDFIVKLGNIDKDAGITSGIVTVLEIIKKALLGLIETFPQFTLVVGGATVALLGFGGAVALLGGPITILVGAVGGLALGLGYLSSVITDVENQMGDLQSKIDDNKISQDNLKNSYDNGLISLAEYNKQSAILITTQEDLKKKNEELEGSFSYMFASIVAGVKSAFKIFAGVIATGLIFVGELVGNTVGFIVENVKLIPKNFGIAFDNIPYYIQNGLNIALGKVQDFINKYKNLLNKIPGVNIGDVNFNKLSGATKKEFDFVGISKDNFKLTIKAVDTLSQEFENFGKVAVKTNNDIIKSQNDVIKNSDETNKKLQITGGGGGGGGGGGSKAKVKTEEEIQKELEKLRQEEEKKEQERIKELEKLREEQRKAEEEREKAKNTKIKDNLKILEDGYNSVAKVFDKSIADSQKRTDDFIKDIKKLNDEIAEIEQGLADLEQGRAKTLGERNVAIEKEIEKLQNELKNGADISIANSIGLSTLKKIGTGDVGGGQRVEDLILAIEKQQELNKLLEEQKLISQNATQEELNEAKRLASLSPTALFLEQFEARKLALEEDRALRLQEVADLEQQKADEEAILQAFTDKKADIDQRYTDKKIELEGKITDNLFIENQKRINSLKALEQQAIRTAQALARAGVSGVNTSGNTSNTINNNPTVVVNANVSSNVDVNNLGNQLANKITLSSKGID